MLGGTHLLKKFFLRGIAGRVVRLAWFLAPKRHFDGITVGLFSPDPKEVNTLFRKVHEALHMIATYDPSKACGHLLVPIVARVLPMSPVYSVTYVSGLYPK